MNTPIKAESQPAQITARKAADDTLILTLSGRWTLDQALPGEADLKAALAGQGDFSTLSFETDTLAAWDSALLVFLIKLRDLVAGEGLSLALEGLPDGARRLLQLTAAVPKREGAEKTQTRDTLLARTGAAAINLAGSVKTLLDFIGDAALAFGRLLTGRATFRSSDLTLIIQETGAEALPIVTLISVLIGLILAFVGAVQLAMFGAQVYVADLVAIAMLREMGAMMTGIIMAGRTGAAFAAQLGTMQVNEEIDALKTLGLQPMEFLVLPRVLALVLMMPLLCIYADLLGILGGAIVGIGAFDITPVQYFEQTRSAAHLSHFLLGVVKSVIFGVVIALAGCQRGMSCGRSATEVGYAATSAVVTAIVVIIALDGLFAVITNVLGI
jgi:phospholipid/cholesterol/gamma-HCH transport system permease protein